jgi:hypothetical protein
MMPYELRNGLRAARKVRIKKEELETEEGQNGTGKKGWAVRQVLVPFPSERSTTDNTSTYESSDSESDFHPIGHVWPG